MVSKKEMVEKLVEAGMSVVDAEKHVDAVFNKVKTIYPDKEEYVIWGIVSTLVTTHAEKIKSEGGQVFEGLVIAVSDKRDIFASRKRRALAAYRKNKEQAILDGLVKIDEATGEPVPIDRNGRPLPTVMSRDVYMIINGELKIVQGDFDCDLEIGKIYSFMGKGGKGTYIKYSNLKPFEETGVVSPADLWETTYRVLESLGDFRALNVVSLSDLPDTYNYSVVATIGIVLEKRYTSKGIVLIIEDFDDPTGTGVTVFADKDYDVNEGNEIIVIGLYYRKDNEMRINAYGIIVNPEESLAVNELKEVFYDFTEQ